jgi:hypothetical protein
MGRAFPYLFVAGILVGGGALSIALGWTTEEGFGGGLGAAALIGFGLVAVADWITRFRRARRQAQSER